MSGEVSVERTTYTTMDEQLCLLADAVERILSEPFTVRELVVPSPNARERSAAGQALADPTADARLTSRLGTRIDDPTCIQWGSIHEFTGLEAPAVILTHVDLSKGYHRDLLCGCVARNRSACGAGVAVAVEQANSRVWTVASLRHDVEECPN